jgi:LysM repeat protein
MVKNIRKIIISTFLVTVIALPSTAFATARNIQQFYGFSLPAYKAVVSTSAQYKIKTNASWVMNITKMTYTNSVSTYLADTSGNRVSDYSNYSGGRLTIKD